VRSGTETIATASAQIASGSHELSSRNEALVIGKTNFTQ
jgi:X-X-X-Leu-X-X-Gly heptad repeat protein